jgi:hypothetical protein
MISIRVAGVGLLCTGIVCAVHRGMADVICMHCMLVRNSGYSRKE